MRFDYKIKLVENFLKKLRYCVLNLSWKMVLNFQKIDLKKMLNLISRTQQTPCIIWTCFYYMYFFIACITWGPFH